MHRISPASPLPAITSPVTINGYSQLGSSPNTLAQGNNAVLLIEIHGANAGQDETTGLHITAGNSTVKGLVINGFSGDGIHLDTSGANVISGNFIGTDHQGAAAVPNELSGVHITSSNNTVGGLEPGARNLLSGNDVEGVHIEFEGSTSNQILGNYIGTDRHGLLAIGNGGGVRIENDASDNAIGSEQSAGRNIISGNYVDGVAMSGTAGNRVIGNYIGTDRDGQIGLGNGADGVSLFGGSNIIGGGAAARNVIAANAENGIFILFGDNNIVLGNYIGLAADGNTALANTNHGIRIKDSSNNIVGGTQDGERNVISANGDAGIAIISEVVDATGNRILGNYVGTDSTGTADRGNGSHGVFVLNGSANIIGGATQTPGEGPGNVISGNGGSGIFITAVGGAANSNTILSNLIGTDKGGSARLANDGDGVTIGGGNTNLIGDTAADTRNIISGNKGNGVAILGVFPTNGAGNLVQNNYIGVAINGNDPLGNDKNGVLVDGGSVNRIGNPGAGNVISGNGTNQDPPSESDDNGVFLKNARDNFIQGNLIGTNSAANDKRPNRRDGVALQVSSWNLIGGANPGAGNVISGNDHDGVDLFNCTDNTVFANYIGTDTAGAANLGNAKKGINVIGATRDKFSGNTIRFNGDNAIGLLNANQTEIATNVILSNNGHGVVILSGTQNLISANSIYDNAGLGIDLGDDGVTANDNLDPDTGPNNLQNYPILSSAIVTPGGIQLRVEGILNSTTWSPFDVELFHSPSCDPSGYGEGLTPIGGGPVLTDDDGEIGFIFFSGIQGGEWQPGFITATATDADRNTSEFSPCVPVTFEEAGAFAGGGAVLRSRPGKQRGDKQARFEHKGGRMSHPPASPGKWSPASFDAAAALLLSRRRR